MSQSETRPYVLTALNKCQPGLFTELLLSLQARSEPSIQQLLMLFINKLVEQNKQFLLIMDDYDVISNPAVHTSCLYLIEHLPPQLQIVIATRQDPPFPLTRFRIKRRMLELRVEQLRCTLEEARAFIEDVMYLSLIDEVVQEIVLRTEGWLAGLQLAALSLQGQGDWTLILDELTGSQYYILDYLTDEVLRQQPEHIQKFLLQTSILERLSAPLCDAIVGQNERSHLVVCVVTH